VCFDGGCGTGRFSIAMAELGAKHVIAADIGTESLKYLSKAIEKYNLWNIEVVEQDVTDLTQWADNSFDFVVSNGVLHHTVQTERGIKEHFRVTVHNGLFFLYLYGSGGVYWETYDKLKILMNQISIDDIKAVLIKFSIREGLIYTYLDNICAPIRKYYSVSNVIKLLKEEGDLTCSYLKGTCQGDDPELQGKTKYFKEIYGPEGEVRVLIRKNGK
jgi:ubiquinone/menaquinone biosynthesis C-methylase UbiE